MLTAQIPLVGRMRRRALALSVLAVLTALGLASGAQAAPMDVSFTVVNQRGVNQFSFIKLEGSSEFSRVTDGNGRFSAGGFSCLYQGGPCVSPGDHIHFSRDAGAGGPCAAPEDPAGLEYVVTSSPSQTVTLPNTTGDSTHTSLTNTESWIVGRLNQDRAAHNPPLPALHVSSTLNLVAYAIAHDRALASTHPYPPPFCNVNLSDWGWPFAGFLNEDSPYPAPEATLAHWDGTAGDPESIYLASHGVYNMFNTAVGVADGGGTWIIEYNDCSGVAPAFVARCGMTSDTGNPNAYTPPPPGGGTTGGGTTGGGGGAGTTGTNTGTATQSLGGGSLSLGSSGPPVTATSSAVTVTLDCTGASGKTCTGQVSVFVRERNRGGKVLAVLTRLRKSKTRTVKVLVGLATYTIAAGQIKTVTVALNATGRSLLKRFHRLTVAVNVNVSTTNGLSQVASKTVSIKANVIRKRHKK